jgi:hypothetical protein
MEGVQSMTQEEQDHGRAVSSVLDGREAGHDV